MSIACYFSFFPTALTLCSYLLGTVVWVLPSANHRAHLGRQLNSQELTLKTHLSF